MGGEDLDSKLVSHFVSLFRRKTGKDISTSPRALRRLRHACEGAKRTLSTTATTNVHVDSLYEGIDMNETLSRARFEEICSEDFRKCLEIVIQTLHEGNIEKNSIDQIILVGGSTRIPKIQSMLEGYFQGKKGTQTDTMITTRLYYEPLTTPTTNTTFIHQSPRP